MMENKELFTDNMHKEIYLFDKPFKERAKSKQRTVPSMVKNGLTIQKVIKQSFNGGKIKF